MQSNVNIEKQVEATNIPAVRDENDEVIVGPKLEKDNRLVFDPRKLIENNDAIFNIPYEEIDVETILIKSDDEGRVAKFNEDSVNRVDRFDEAAGKNDIKNDSLKMQNDINMGDELKCKHTWGKAKKQNAKTISDRNESKEWSDLACSVDCEREIGDKNPIYEIRGNDNRLNDDNVEVSEMAIDDHDIPDLEAKKGDYRDEAPDGKAEIVNIEIKNIKEIREESCCSKIKFVIIYELDEKFCQ
ncbi:hypothetical protein C2G38_2040667 [Gigaspora rosea]|uniref:Uncharacterized protein n=1 Tax=Gigaspora rosea TaxID=44941 RepID=A0A397UW32_9GLOM|nr:hypothetical protein C2G38_2040667 [Gigaspora rosea]